MQASRFPFEYPKEAHRRKHGPADYSHYSKYRDWLRDEFEFRCVYCLRREAWEMLEGCWDIDHFVPRAIRSDLALDYDNLVYACHRCNQCKRVHLFPDPCQHAYGKHLQVGEDGSIRSSTPEGHRMIRLLKLDTPSAKRYRYLKVRTGRSFLKNDPAAYAVFMGYPAEDELPDIEALNRKISRNSRPEGVEKSCLARKRSGTLPQIY